MIKSDNMVYMLRSEHEKIVEVRVQSVKKGRKSQEERKYTLSGSRKYMCCLVKNICEGPKFR